MVTFLYGVVTDAFFSLKKKTHSSSHLHNPDQLYIFDMHIRAKTRGVGTVNYKYSSLFSLQIFIMYNGLLKWIIFFSQKKYVSMLLFKFSATLPFPQN